MKRLIVLIASLLFTACDRGQFRDDELGRDIARAMVDACPFGDSPADELARNACAGKLAALPELKRAMREPFLWGGQQPGAGYSLAKGTSKFNARVWRKLYASTFMFGGDPTYERVAGQTIVHVPVRFRYAMSTGAYPYPFWHVAKKWNSYSFATTICLVVEDGKLIGALRALDQDTTRPKIPHDWDGRWQWQDDGVQMPYASLYGWLLSKGNPHLAELEGAYRVLETRMRTNRCNTCHEPDNRGHADQLELLEYPNQALVARHEIASQLGDNQMPPENDLGVKPGIADTTEQNRLIGLARDFAAAGDAALAWEDAQEERL